MHRYRYRGQVRPEAAARQAAIETGDHSDAGLRQGAHQHPQIVWTNRHIAVSHDDERMTSDLPHIDEVGDLTVNPMRGAVDDEMKFKLGIALNQRFDDRNRPIVRILDAENELNFARIVLMEIGLDILG